MTHCLICGKESLQFVCKECEAKVVERSNGHKRALKDLTAENEKLKKEQDDIKASLDMCPQAVRVREGGADLDLAASIAVTLSKLGEQPGHKGCPACHGEGKFQDSTEGGIWVACDCASNIYAELEELRRITSYLPMHACVTGDCPHENANECLKALIKEIESLTRKE